jgi:muramoyltetrapeptide carboxypeptidase LdcA involved in peptidoglycan recycling
MIYPKFLKPGDTIGICAPSRGIDPNKANFEIALNNFRKEGYEVYETQNVRTGLLPSSSAETRAKDFNELVKDDNINFIFAATGGDYLIEILPLLDEEAIKEKIASGDFKWIAGYSDPTSLLYYLTTKFDVATFYGVNAASFDQYNPYTNLASALSMMKGEVIPQESFDLYQVATREETDALEDGSYILNTPVEWKTINGDVDIKGRIIGGCIDCIKYMIGTKFDYTKDFIERYKDDGIIWYFDNYALGSEDLFYTLWQMREAGYFKYTKGIIFGRVMYESSFLDVPYEDSIKRALGEELPIIIDADIGHARPTFNIINGSIAHIWSADGKGSLEMEVI